MGRKRVVLLFAKLLPCACIAQTLVCGTRWSSEIPYAQYATSQVGSRDSIGNIIPVVFHILHENGPENISDAQVIDALMLLNSAFGMVAGDTLGVYPGNTVVTADIGIQFCLATIDPVGMTTTGIIRYETPLTNDGLDPAAKLDPWPRERYMNVWVVKAAGGGFGYTLHPEEADALPLEDGVVILHNYLGSIGTSGVGRYHTITHDVGHYFGLLHPWDIPTGFGTCGDDLVDDTPITTPEIYCPRTLQAAHLRRLSTCRTS